MTIKKNDYCEINKFTKPCKKIKFNKSISYYITLIKKLDWKGDLSLKNNQNNQMSLEIERRFLIKNDQWKEFITHKTFIEQGYLSYDLEDWIIRIRFNGKKYKIALKKHIKNFTNYEYEYSIPNSEGEKIMATLTNTIKKERFFLKVNQRNWIIDCFKEENFPLEIAEIELT